MSKVITDLDCSGETSYELGTVYEMENNGEKSRYIFGYPNGVTKEQIEKYDLKPGWGEENVPNSSLICGSPVKEKTEKKEKTINKNWFILLIIIGIATMAMSQTIKKQ